MGAGDVIRAAEVLFARINTTKSIDGKNETLERIKGAELEMQVILGMANVEINDVLDLKVDDVIKLDQKLDKELIACVNKKKKFFVVPGVIQNKVCVKIVDQYQEKE